MLKRNQITVPLSVMARRLSVPPAWLRAEAEAGRLPALKTGSAFLFDPTTVERIVADRVRNAARQGVAHG